MEKAMRNSEKECACGDRSTSNVRRLVCQSRGGAAQCCPRPSLRHHHAPHADWLSGLRVNVCAPKCGDFRTSASRLTTLSPSRAPPNPSTRCISRCTPTIHLSRLTLPLLSELVEHRARTQRPLGATGANPLHARSLIPANTPHRRRNGRRASGERLGLQHQALPGEPPAFWLVLAHSLGGCRACRRASLRTGWHGPLR